MSATSRVTRSVSPGTVTELTKRELRAIEAGVKALPRPMDAECETAFRQAGEEFAVPEYIVNATLQLARERALH
jgi:hypothetical protein